MAIETVTVPEATAAELGASPAALQRLSERTWRRKWERLLHKQKAASEQALALAEANRRMEEFLGIATHELKTPVTSSRLAVALASRRIHDLLDQVPGRGNLSNMSGAELANRLAALQELLTQAEESLERCTQLVAYLLDVSRIRTGQLDLRLAPCDLAAVVREAVTEQRQIAPARTIRLHLLDCSVVPVVADAKRIRQVVTNYLTNALRYSPADRPVEVGVQVLRTWARVMVRDEGLGLRPAEQQRIWERFHRVARIQVVGNDTGTGLGLGLHLCKTIVKQHKGRLGVRSMPGKGSTFWFALAVAGVDRPRVERMGDP
jgi:signal transduction histidine kinase